MTMATTGEFGLIARVTARLGIGPTCLLGPGDDAAVVVAPDSRVVATTDVLVEGRHFRRDWCGARDVGHRAAAANLADVAAMGAVPTALLVALCVPADLDVAWAEELADGLAAEAANSKHPAVLVGDLNITPFSPQFQDVLEVGRLRDGRKGHGMKGTWPSPTGFPRIPIDHVLVAEEIKVNTLRVERAAKSDHFAVITELGF